MEITVQVPNGITHVTINVIQEPPEPQPVDNVIPLRPKPQIASIHDEEYNRAYVAAIRLARESGLVTEGHC